MWTIEHRRAADRRGLRYPSDLTEAEWALVVPFVPPARRGGRKREDLPPKSTAHDYFILLDRDGALQRMHEALYLMAREQAGREASPTAAIIDSQSAKAAQKGALGWTRKDMMRARKSSAANATFSSTRSGFC